MPAIDFCGPANAHGDNAALAVRNCHVQPKHIADHHATTDDSPIGTSAGTAPVRLSIVTVCFNDLQGLEATCNSLREQTEAPREWIVADGGSSDGTVEWLATRDWHPLSWTSERDNGIYFGMNRGLGVATGQYVLFLNSGDTLATADTLSRLHAALEADASLPALVFGHCFEVATDGTVHHRKARKPNWVPVGMPTSHQAMCFRRDAIGDGYDVRFRLSGDYALVARLFAASRGADFRQLPFPVCRFQLGGRSESRRASALIEDGEIRRRILGMGSRASTVLDALHRAHAMVKRHAPVLHRMFRYD